MLKFGWIPPRQRPKSWNGVEDLVVIVASVEGCLTLTSHATTSVSAYTELKTHPRPWSLNMVQLSTEVQLIKAVCTAEMQRVGFRQKTEPKIVLLCDIIRKCYRGSTYRNYSGDHNKGIACRYVVDSIRAQVVRSYTCVTTTQAIFPYPLIPAQLHIIERVSHLSHLHRASVSRYSALAKFSCDFRSPPSPCPVWEIVCTAAPRCPVSFCPSSPSPFAEVSVPSDARLFNCPICRSMWIGSDFVPMSARFSADVHALTMTIPYFTNCCGQRTLVDKWRSVLTPSRLQTRAAALSKSSVRTSNSMNKKQQDSSDQHLLYW